MDLSTVAAAMGDNAFPIEICPFIVIIPLLGHLFHKLVVWPVVCCNSMSSHKLCANSIQVPILKPDMWVYTQGKALSLFFISVGKLWAAIDTWWHTLCHCPLSGLFQFIRQQILRSQKGVFMTPDIAYFPFMGLILQKKSRSSSRRSK